MIRKRLVAVVIVVDGTVVQSESFNHTNIIHSDAYHAVEAFSSWDVDEIVLHVSRNNPRNQLLGCCVYSIESLLGSIGMGT